MKAAVDFFCIVVRDTKLLERGNRHGIKNKGISSSPDVIRPSNLPHSIGLAFSMSLLCVQVQYTWPIT